MKRPFCVARCCHAANRIGRPEKLFTLPVEWSGFAPAPKGDRFLLLERVGYRSPSLILVDIWRTQPTPWR